jgi:hypothetical protein
MRHLNPTLVVILLGVLLVAVIWQKYEVEKRIEAKQKALFTLEEKGRKLTALKSYWGAEKQKVRVREFIRFAEKFITKQEPRGTRIRIKLENLDGKNADRVVNRLLNSFIIVKSLTIKRTSKEKISMETELVY